jgi:hypothetical protein
MRQHINFKPAASNIKPMGNAKLGIIFNLSALIFSGILSPRDL